MKKILVLIYCLANFSVSAQTIKTDVLVVGANAGGLAAAIQAARSGVKTLLIEESGKLGANIVPVSKTSGGLWEEFMKRVRAAKKDSLAQPDPVTNAAVLKAWTDTIKNLTIRYAGWQKIEKNGKGWELKLKDKSTVKTNVVVDALPITFLASAAGIFTDPKTKLQRTVVTQGYVTKPYENKLYRTSVGSGTNIKTGEPYVIPLGALIASGQENYFLAGKLTETQSPADAMFTGQAAGASAAFFAFFDTSTKSMSLGMFTRKIQSELLTYKSVLFPYTDIKSSDPNYLQLQQFGLTGILKAKQTGNEFLFAPDATVSSQEIRSVMKEYYSRSQIWFADKDIAALTLGDLIELLKYTAVRGKELNREIEQGWKNSFGFTGTFDLKHVVTRREVAVLMALYLRPVDVRVNLAGNLGN